MVQSPRPSLDALIAAAGIDVSHGLQIVAADQLRGCNPALPVLLLCDTPSALQPDILAQYPADTEALVLSADSGADAVQQRPINVAEIAAGALRDETSLRAVVLPAIAADEIRYDFRGLRGVIARLRDPVDGCPWDLAQDHKSLRPHLLEETYEVLSALDGGDPAALREELGDLLMQIVLHAQIADQNGDFDIDDVSEGIREKLVRRHPHVFADVEADTPDQVSANWDKIKATERDDSASALDGVPPALPSLARAQSLAGRAARKGFAWPDDDAVLAKLAEELRELRDADDAHAAEEFGDLLFVVADFARHHKIEAEDALREACAKFERRFRTMEASLNAENVDLASLDHEEMLRRWDQAKKAEAGS